MTGGRPAAFLDRDGVITALVVDPASGTPESPHRPADVRLIPGAADALDRLREAGFVVVVASNQPAAAKGIVSDDELDRVHERVLELLGPRRTAVSEWRYCRHHPDAGDPRLGECDCRKPQPGMLLDAAKALTLDLTSSWMIGDSDVDVAAGKAAGCRTVLVQNPDSAHRRTTAIGPDLHAGDLAEAAAAVTEMAR